jgi:hypothetical protein
LDVPDEFTYEQVLKAHAMHHYSTLTPKVILPIFP